MNWISVKERLPEYTEEYREYLVVVKVGDETEIDMAAFDPEHGYIGEWITTYDWDEGQECSITHWMPLPEPPKEEA